MFTSKEIKKMEKENFRTVSLTNSAYCSGEDVFLYNACFMHAIDEVQKYRKVCGRTVYECKKIENENLRNSMLKIIDILDNINPNDTKFFSNLGDVQYYFFKKGSEGRYLVKNKFLEDDKYVLEKDRRFIIDWYVILKFCASPNFVFYKSNMLDYFDELAKQHEKKYNGYIPHNR